jgi:hypothetical protein
MPLDWDGIKNQVYECALCHATFKAEKCMLIDRLACPKLMKFERNPGVCLEVMNSTTSRWSTLSPSCDLCI